MPKLLPSISPKQWSGLGSGSSQDRAPSPRRLQSLPGKNRLVQREPDNGDKIGHAGHTTLFVHTTALQVIEGGDRYEAKSPDSTTLYLWVLP